MNPNIQDQLKQKVKRALLPLFGNFLEEINANEKFRGSISATSTDPGKDLEDRYLSLSEEDQKLVAGLYYQYQGRLNTFVVRGFFE